MNYDGQVTFLVLDYRKPNETKICLQSIADFTRFDHQVILLVNGANQTEDYSRPFIEDGLVDKVILNTANTGLGIGTTDLFKMCDTPFAIYMQNDQYLAREFGLSELNGLIDLLGRENDRREEIRSISLAGAPCGEGIYSERAHIIRTSFYNSLPTDIYGAGPYHDGMWNEEIIQNYYKENGFTHYISPYPIVADNGHAAIRENPDGSVWKHYPDTKELWLLKGPVKERHVYPKFTDAEWARVLDTQEWDGRVPKQELEHSFTAFDR